jgi:hypothetical protein
MDQLAGSNVADPSAADQPSALDQALDRLDRELTDRAADPTPAVRYECTSWSSGPVRS